MTTQITLWIHSKLEYIFGTLGGVSTLAFQIKHDQWWIVVTLKILMAVILGAAGAIGSHGVKIAIEKFSKKKRK